MKDQVLQALPMIGISIMAGVLGQTALKLGMSTPEAKQLAAGGAVALVSVLFRSPLVLLGLALYGIGAVAWIGVLSKLDLGYAYPFLALNFVLITLISRLVLGESVPTLRWIGIAVICLGILLVARSSTGA